VAAACVSLLSSLVAWDGTVGEDQRGTRSDRAPG
jgi:hypothetical protein